MTKDPARQRELQPMALCEPCQGIQRNWRKAPGHAELVQRGNRKEDRDHGPVTSEPVLRAIHVLRREREPAAMALDVLPQPTLPHPPPEPVPRRLPDQRPHGASNHHAGERQVALRREHPGLEVDWLVLSGAGEKKAASGD